MICLSIDILLIITEFVYVGGDKATIDRDVVSGDSDPKLGEAHTSIDQTNVVWLGIALSAANSSLGAAVGPPTAELGGSTSRSNRTAKGTVKGPSLLDCQQLSHQLTRVNQ